MVDDTDRLLGTVEQVLKAGQASHKKANHRVPLNFGDLVQECVDVARTSHHLEPEALRYEQEVNNGAGSGVVGDSEELRTAVSNGLDDAIKYSGPAIDISVRLETPDDRHVTRIVRDHGVGISAHELKRTFKHCYRALNLSLPKTKGAALVLFLA